MTNPPNMNGTDQRRLDAILATSTQLTALAGHVRTFATVLCSRRGQELEAWMTTVDTDDHQHCGHLFEGCAVTTTRSKPGSPCAGAAGSAKAA